MQDNGRLTLTVAEAAIQLGLSRNAAYLGCKNGQIPCITIGKRILVPKIQLERMLEGRLRASPANL